jgi:hypothetical protein
MHLTVLTQLLIIEFEISIRKREPQLYAIASDEKELVHF